MLGKQCEGYVSLHLSLFVDDGDMIANVTEHGTKAVRVQGETTERPEVRGFSFTLASAVNRVVEGARGVTTCALFLSVGVESRDGTLVDDLAHVRPVMATPPK